MGKTEDDVNLHAGGESSGDSAERNTRCGCCKWISGFVGFKCLFVLLLSVSVFLSAFFLLLPFAVDREHSNLDPRFRGHAIVASFSINRPASFLSENIMQLRDDIFQEMSYISLNVTILAIDPSDGLNITKVVFAIDHDKEYREILPFSLSSVKEMFESVLISQSTLQLTKSLFEETFLFEVLKFPGGITVIPPQSAFPLQKFKIDFNFTLNYSIHQIQINFDSLASQLKNGLNLAPYENLYVSLSNTEGSTVSPPTTVHSSVLLRVGTSNSSPRLKQLTDTITGSRSRNLGLNNTMFGKVKQVRLSSFLPNSSDSTKSPSPSPSPDHQHHHHHHHHPHHHHHRHHHDHHHNHHHHLNPNMAPEVPPVASPAPQRSHWKAPSAPPPCNLGNRRGKRVHFKEKHVHISSTPAPAPSARPPHHQLQPRGPIPAARPHIVPISAPLPHVVFAHAAQPPKTIASKSHANEVGQPQPQSSSSTNAGLPAMSWIVLPILMLIVGGLHE